MRNDAYNMDCIEYMRGLPDNVFDIAVCDPPYGKGNDDNLVNLGGQNQDLPTSRRFGGSVQTLRQADGTDCWEDGVKDTTSQRTHRFSGGTWAERYKIGGGQSRSSTMGRRSSTGVLR